MRRLALLGLIAVLLGAYLYLDLGRYLDLGYFKSQQAAIEAYRAAHPLKLGGLYFVAYVVMAALSIPGAALMTLIAGALFGLFWGTLLSSFASTLGATLAFLSARFLMRDVVQRRWGSQLSAINAGVEREGAFYLFALRLVPIFPFFLINLLMGLTPIGSATFLWVSQIGMLPGTLVYVNAGRELGRLESLSGIASPTLLLSFALLGLFPLGARRALAAVKARRQLRPYPRPRRFDRNLIVIGAGSAGLVAAYLGAALKARVTLIERDRMGGDCLNTGCVPSKALIRSARLIEQIKRAGAFGLRARAEVDFPAVMERVRRVIQAVEPHDSEARYQGLGVEVLHGEARIVTPYEVELDGRRLSARSIVIATGARPLIPPIPGLPDIDYLSSETVWGLRALPRRLLVLGGGPIGCELAQAFHRLGSGVTLVELLPRLLPREDAEISERVMERFTAEGIALRVGHRALAFRREDGGSVLLCEHAGAEVRIGFDRVLVAVGRVANTAGLGLEALGIPLSRNGAIEANEFLQAVYPNIFVCGDVVGPYQFTHVAAHQAWYAAMNALFGGWRRFRADYSVIPYAVFTDPELARVGLNEVEAQARGIAYEVTRYGIEDLDRAIADEEAHGIVKILTVPGKDRILGATIVGAQAAEVIAELVVAMRHGLGLNKVLRTIHIYPTLAEANKHAAGAWRRAHAPRTVLTALERYHGWRRGP